jgi:hypothetical protein
MAGFHDALEVEMFRSGLHILVAAPGAVDDNAGAAC